jgi:hypothetical protein
MVEAISDIRPMVSPIALMASTDSFVAFWMPLTCWPDLVRGFGSLVGL